MNPLISIIVPVYNIENFVGFCIESLVKQTYTNIEIILVDDGSNDNSKNICEKYALHDNRIKIIHQNNAGVSAARNKGIEAAKGDYIAFVDGDDYCDKNIFKKLYESLIKYNADIVCCRWNEVKNNKIIETGGYCYDENEKLFIKNEFVEEYVKKFDLYVWNKLYRAEIIKSNIFPVNIAFGEDFFTVFKWINCAGKIVYIKQPLYFRINRSDSLTGSDENLFYKLSCSFNQLRYFKDYISKFDKNIIRNFNKRYMRSLYSLRCQLEDADKNNDEYDVFKNELETEVIKFKDYKSVLGKSKRLKLFFVMNFKFGYQCILLWEKMFKRIEKVSRDLYKKFRNKI